MHYIPNALCFANQHYFLSKCGLRLRNISIFRLTKHDRKINSIYFQGKSVYRQAQRELPKKSL